MYICQLCMAHITLSIPDEIYTEMKKHPEIKWSEIARQNIVEKTLLMKRGLHTKEIFKMLPKKTQESILKRNKDKDLDFYKKMKEKEWKRKKYLIQV